MHVKTYPAKYLLFFLPFIAILCIELFILPIHTFTFRTWESLIVKHSFGILKGPFYPDMKVSMIEEGSLAYRTPWAVKKDVIWVTDKHGYRKANSPLNNHSIIIVGDSNVAGSALSQHELLSEALERRFGVGVYPLSPERLRVLHSNSMFLENPPGLVIMESIERGLRDPKVSAPLRPAEFEQPSSFSRLIRTIRLNSILQKIAILADRTLKANMLQHLRARINRNGPSMNLKEVKSECPALFLHGAQVNRDLPMEQIDQISQRLKESRDVLLKKGIRFIFLPVPNKETIYFKCLGIERPIFLDRLVQRLRELNVEVIDTLPAFEKAYQQRSMMLYHFDDEHWNAEGVKLAAELLERQIRYGGFSFHQKTKP
jgi:alginate O-acetyltransferase complex protein AlgJ